MTDRVYDCRGPIVLRARRPAAQHAETPSRTNGLGAAALACLLAVPIVGAAQAPEGWMVAGATTLASLILILIVGGRAPWGWMAVVLAGVGIAAPRGQLALIGPGLCVAILASIIMWLANRPNRGSRAEDRPRPGTPEREAQLHMGRSGEVHVAQVLARELPSDYVLINGLSLPHGAGDVDHLVIGPTGVFLIETKTMAGQITCESDGTWRRTRTTSSGMSYPAYIGDPAAQVQRNIFAVRDCLRRRAPHLFWGTPLWIEGLVVFPHPRTELKTDRSRVPAIRIDEASGRIRSHVPKRALQPAEVEQVLQVLRDETQQSRWVMAQTAQALVEMALALPIVLSLVIGTIAITRMVQAQTAVVVVAHEAARAAALGNNTDDAIARMRRRVELVAPGVGIDASQVVLEWDVTRLNRDPGQVVATVRYVVDLSDLPLAGWVPPRMVSAEHVEWVDPFRAGISVSDNGP